MKANLNRFIILVLALFFLSPVLIIFYYFKIHFDTSTQDLWWAFKNSALQSVSTAVLCIFGALALIPGLSRLKNNWFNLALLPSLLPSLFTILIVFSFFKDFPFGTWGIVLIFSITYFGMTTVILQHSYQVLVNRYWPLVKIYNISVWDRYRLIYAPGLQKDILNVFLIIVLGCFSSLSVPLLAGGGKSINVEIFIYESIFIRGEWGTAALMAAIQMVMMFVLGAYLNRVTTEPVALSTNFTLPTKKINLSGFFFGCYIALYIGGYLFQVVKSLFKAPMQEFYSADFFTSLTHSFLLALLTVAGFFLITVALFYLDYRKARSSFLIYFLMPSSTVVGLALYLFFSEGGFLWADAFKLALGFNIIYALALYKSYIHPSWRTLSSQRDVLNIYGVSFLTSLREVFLPQMRRAVGTCILILTMYSFCEFALVKAVGAQNLFSGVYIERLISTYRLEQGFIYSFIILILMFCFFQVMRFLNVED